MVTQHHSYYKSTLVPTFFPFLSSPLTPTSIRVTSLADHWTNDPFSITQTHSHHSRTQRVSLSLLFSPSLSFHRRREEEQKHIHCSEWVCLIQCVIRSNDPLVTWVLNEYSAPIFALVSRQYFFFYIRLLVIIIIIIIIVIVFYFLYFYFLSLDTNG